MWERKQKKKTGPLRTGQGEADSREREAAAVWAHGGLASGVAAAAAVGRCTIEPFVHRNKAGRSLTRIEKSSASACAKGNRTGVWSSTQRQVKQKRRESSRHTGQTDQTHTARAESGIDGQEEGWMAGYEEGCWMFTSLLMPMKRKTVRQRARSCSIQ